MTSVRLQVVGIYYSYDIDTSNVADGYTVKQILDMAQAQTNSDGSTLAYAFAQAPGGNYVDFIAATYPNNISSPVSGTTYVAGTYGLAQTFTSMNGSTYSVWQYYIFDSNNTIVPADPNGTTKELPFDQATAVYDGYTVVWRLVTICGATQAPVSANLASNVTAPGLNARLAKLIGKPFGKV